MLAVLLNLGFAGGGQVAPAPEEPNRGGTGGRGYRYLPGEFPKRKFTKKDETELKNLLLKVVEDEKNAQERLERKAESLSEVVNAAEGIRRAIDAAQKVVRQQALSQKLEWDEAKRRIKEIEEEEEVLLLLAAL